MKRAKRKAGEMVKRKIADYTYEWGLTFEATQRRVCEFVNTHPGYELVGGVQYAPLSDPEVFRYCQCLVKYAEQDE